jgi:WD40 repeat protein
MFTRKLIFLKVAVAGLVVVSLWHLVPRLLRLISIQQVGAMAFSPDGKNLVVGAGWFARDAVESWDGEVRVWDAQTGQLKQHMTSFRSQVTWLAYAPDGRSLATYQHEDEVYSLWDSQTGTPPLKWTVEKERLTTGGNHGSSTQNR